MQVILVKPVRKLGKVGNTVTVADGFGRNYLIPQEFAIRATKENIAKFASLQKGMEAKNSEHKEQAEKEGRTNLGDDIFIHGKSSSTGCLAIGDEPIEELFVLARLVGQNNVDVIISPKDLQDNRVALDEKSPSWLGVLYQKIGEALKPFQRKAASESIRAEKQGVEHIA